MCVSVFFCFCGGRGVRLFFFAVLLVVVWWFMILVYIYKVLSWSSAIAGRACFQVVIPEVNHRGQLHAAEGCFWRFFRLLQANMFPETVDIV